jgi:hypothetical protein
MITGRYQDVVVSPRRERRILPWRSNLIVSGCYELVAALMMGEPGTSGVLWWAIGTGDVAANPDQTSLAAEFHRRRVHLSHMAFVDELGRVRNSPTRHLRVRAAFRAERLAAIPTEFGVFGGDASGEPGSGTMINRVVHPPLELAAGDLLERQLVLSFGVTESVERPATGLGDGWPLRTIKGIDTVYIARLSEAGIATVGELADFDPGHVVPGVPPSRLREFVEKALLLRRYRPLARFESLRDEPILEILQADPADVADRSHATLDPDDALDVQRALGILQVAVDADVLRRMRISELLLVTA